jgi:hypothetical protein
MKANTNTARHLHVKLRIVATGITDLDHDSAAIHCMSRSVCATAVSLHAIDPTDGCMTEHSRHP